jgi:MFS family permease
VAFAVDDGAQRVFVGLLAGAAGLWIVAAAVYARVDEEPGETDGGGNAFGEALRRMRLLVEDRAFGMFVVVRALLLCSALSAPYYVLLARQHSGGFTGKLGLFIVAGGLASSLSAPLWGRLADWSSRRVMGVAAVVTGVLGMVVFIAETWIPVLGGAVGFYPMVYFVLMVAHSGVRLGRKTYVVDLAQGNRRTDYVAVSNTVIGVILLVLGSLGALAQAFSVPIVVLVLSMLGLFGAALSRWLPEVT